VAFSYPNSGQKFNRWLIFNHNICHFTWALPLAAVKAGIAPRNGGSFKCYWFGPLTAARIHGPSRATEKSATGD
jgi:hypothetical protein